MSDHTVHRREQEIHLELPYPDVRHDLSRWLPARHMAPRHPSLHRAVLPLSPRDRAAGVYAASTTTDERPSIKLINAGAQAVDLRLSLPACNGTQARLTTLSADPPPSTPCPSMGPCDTPSSRSGPRSISSGPPPSQPRTTRPSSRPPGPQPERSRRTRCDSALQSGFRCSELGSVALNLDPGLDPV
jgi:hypothetical protein